jgi:hypothetical protein
VTGWTDLLAAGVGRFFRNRNIHRGQILILAVVVFFLFFLIATVLIDVYTLFEARNWGYRVAQQAALAGASYTTSKWTFIQPTVDPAVDTPTPNPNGCVDPMRVQLDAIEAESAANEMLNRELATRDDVVVLVREVEVHFQTNGDTTYAWPPGGVRLGVSDVDWTTDNPAVGVYLSFHVDTFLLSFLGITPGDIHVFAAAEAAQPPVCPP